MRHNEELKVWLASLILSAEKLKTRAKILAHLIRVGSVLVVDVFQSVLVLMASF